MSLLLEDIAANPIYRRTWVLVSALILCGFLAYLPGLGQDTRLASHEGRHAEIAREMWTSEEYAVPYFAGQLYSDKPPLFHWLVASAYAACGRADILLARVPSMLAAISGAVALFILGRLLYGRWSGFVAGLMLLSTYVYVQWAVMCRMDMVMSAALLWATTFTALAARGRSAPARVAWVVSACLALAAATLSKGFVPLATGIFLMAATWLCLSNRKWLIVPILLLALIAVAAAGAAWAVRTMDTNYLAEFWRFQTGGMGPKHVKSPLYYLARLPLNLLPWSLWLPFAVWDSVLTFLRRHSWKRTFPLLVFAFGVFIFSLSSNKRVHYLLPLVPFAALIVSEYVVHRLRGNHGAKSNQVVRWFLIILLAAAPLAGAGVLFVQKGSIRTGFPLVVAALAALAVLSIFGLRCAAKSRLKCALASMLLAGILLCGTVRGIVAAYYWLPEPEVAEAREIAGKIPPGMPVGLLALKETLSFELPNPPRALEAGGELAQFISMPGKKCIVAKESQLADMKSVFGEMIESATIVTYAGRRPYAIVLLASDAPLDRTAR